MATGFTTTYKNELSINLYDKLVDYVRQEDRLNDFLKYDETQHKVYFLNEITDIFQQAIWNACNWHNVDTEGVENFLTDNWTKLRIDELIDLIIHCVYNHSSWGNKDQRHEKTVQEFTARINQRHN
jgi:hypothetical protein